MDVGIVSVFSLHVIAALAVVDLARSSLFSITGSLNLTNGARALLLSGFKRFNPKNPIMAS